MTRDELHAKFRTLVYDQAERVDASGERDWFDLYYGFALAHDVAPELAYEYAVHARYEECIA